MTTTTDATPEEAAVLAQLELIDPDLVSDHFREVHLMAARHAAVARDIATRLAEAERVLDQALNADPVDIRAAESAALLVNSLTLVQNRLPAGPDVQAPAASALSLAGARLSQLTADLATVPLDYHLEVRRWSGISAAARANTQAPVLTERDAMAQKTIDVAVQAVQRFNQAIVTWREDSQRIEPLTALASASSLLKQRPSELVADANRAARAANEYRRQAGLNWRPPAA